MIKALKILAILLGIFVLFIVFLIYKGDKNYKDSLTPAQKDSIAKHEQFEKETEQWNDSLAARKEKQNDAFEEAKYRLEKYIKDGMNDPNSYDYVDGGFTIQKKNTMLVTIKFRGKNAFGGIVTNFVQAQCDSVGNIIKIITK